MIKIFKDIVAYIKESVKGTDGFISHTKISSYFILGGILTSIVIFSIVDITNALISWKVGKIYTIPMEHIFTYSLTLTHHLILLGLKRGSESDYLKHSTKLNELKFNAQAQAQAQLPYINHPFDNNDRGYDRDINTSNRNNYQHNHYDNGYNNHSQFNQPIQPNKSKVNLNLINDDIIQTNDTPNGDDEAVSSNFNEHNT